MTNYVENYRGQVVLVTGGAGAIGSNLTRALAELGAQVIVLDDLSSAERWNVPSLPGVMFVEGNVLDEVKLKRVFFGNYSISCGIGRCGESLISGSS